MSELQRGEPCGHPGCAVHVTHPCEGCGRVAATFSLADVQALRSALEQARAFMQIHVPSLYVPSFCGDYALSYDCECCNAPLQGGPGEVSHPDGHPDCEYVRTMAAINEALPQGVGALEVTP